jgi:flagellar P-ring protein FlgI
MLRLALAGIALALSFAPCGAARIKDITTPENLRDNALIGYGLVVGLQGSGDSLRNSAFTEQSLQSMLDRMGVNARGSALRTKNIAAVIVTAELPPLISSGSRIDVSVSSLGDANSLNGGTLLLTPLTGPDGRTYAVAQGAVASSGVAAQGQAESVSQGVPTGGRIPNGAIVEREPPGDLTETGRIVLDLRNPDFKTSVAVADAINAYAEQRFHKSVARERDNRSVVLAKPASIGKARFLAEIGDLVVEPDTQARVIIDVRTGTIVIGQDVRISTVAVTHGSISVRISEAPSVSQPQPLSNGVTAVVPQTEIETGQAGGQIAVLGGSNLKTLVRGLNQIGLKPNGIIAILQAIKSAGALQADLVIQ